MVDIILKNTKVSNLTKSIESRYNTAFPCMQNWDFHGKILKKLYIAFAAHNFVLLF